MHSDSPGPAADTTWGNTSSMTNSFNFYASSPQHTPSKQHSPPPGDVQPPQVQMNPNGPRHSTPGQPTSSTNSSFSNNTPFALKVDTNAPFSYGGFPPSANTSRRLDESVSSMSREDMTELAEAFVAQEVEKFRKMHGETMSAEDQMLVRGKQQCQLTF